MKKKSKMLLAILLSMVMVMTAACGSSDSGSEEEAKDENAEGTEEAEEVVLNWMCMETEFAEAQDEINEALHKTYPNITLEITVNNTDYDALLKSKIASGETPDIFELNAGISYIQTFADAGHIDTLTDDGFESLVKDGMLQENMYNDELYSVPLNITGYGMIYNKDVLEQAGIEEYPRTISELEEACEKIEALGIKAVASPFKDSYTAAHAIWGIQSVTYADDPAGEAEALNNGASVNDEKFSQALATLDVLIDHAGDKPLSTGFSDMCAQIATGEAGISIQGDWAAAEILNVNPDANIGFGPIPVSEDPEDANIAMVSGTCQFVSSTTEHREECIQVLKWLLTTEGMNNTVVGLRMQPSTSIESSDIEINALSQDLLDFLDTGAPVCVMFNSYWPSGYETPCGQLTQEYITDRNRDELYQEMDDLWEELK